MIQFSVYPNPASSSFFLKSGITMTSAKVVLVDVLGNVVIDSRLSLVNTVPLEVKTDGIPSGSYFVSVEYQGKKSVQKLTIIR
jgi:hypothetical protein